MANPSVVIWKVPGARQVRNMVTPVGFAAKDILWCHVFKGPSQPGEALGGHMYAVGPGGDHVRLPSPLSSGTQLLPCSDAEGGLSSGALSEDGLLWVTATPGPHRALNIFSTQTLRCESRIVSSLDVTLRLFICPISGDVFEWGIRWDPERRLLVRYRSGRSVSTVRTPGVVIGMDSFGVVWCEAYGAPILLGVDPSSGDELHRVQARPGTRLLPDGTLLRSGGRTDLCWIEPP